MPRILVAIMLFLTSIMLIQWTVSLVQRLHAADSVIVSRVTLMKRISFFLLAALMLYVAIAGGT